MMMYNWVFSLSWVGRCGLGSGCCDWRCVSCLVFCVSVRLLGYGCFCLVCRFLLCLMLCCLSRLRWLFLVRICIMVLGRCMVWVFWWCWGCWCCCCCWIFIRKLRLILVCCVWIMVVCCCGCSVVCCCLMLCWWWRRVMLVFISDVVGKVLLIMWWICLIVSVRVWCLCCGVFMCNRRVRWLIWVGIVCLRYCIFCCCWFIVVFLVVGIFWLLMSICVGVGMVLLIGCCCCVCSLGWIELVV